MGDAATKKLVLQNKADIGKLEKLTGMSRDAMRGVLKNAETLDDIVDAIKSSLTKDPHILQALLKTDTSLKEFLLVQVNAAADKRYVTQVGGSWLNKKMKAAKGAKVKEAIGEKLQDARIFGVLKKPFADLQAALHSSMPQPTPAAKMQQHRAQLKPLDTNKPETAASQEGSSPSIATPQTAQAPAEETSAARSSTPTTASSQAALFAKYGFVSSPTNSRGSTDSTPSEPASPASLSSRESTDSIPSTPLPASPAAPSGPTPSLVAELYKRFGFGAAAEPAAPVHVSTPAEIAKDIKDYGRAFLTLTDSITQLDIQKFGLIKVEDRAAVDQIITESKARLEELRGKVFEGVHDTAILDRLDDKYQQKIVGLQARQKAGQSVQDQLDVCDFILSAIQIRRDEIAE